MDILKKKMRVNLVFDSTNENKKVLKKYTEFWNGIENEIETINGVKNGEYGKDFMKIKFDTDDNLPLDKQLKLQMLTIVVRSVFEIDDKFYPQLFLESFNKKQLMFQKELTLIKQVLQKNVCFVIVLKMLDLNLNHMFVINFMMF